VKILNLCPHPVTLVGAETTTELVPTDPPARVRFETHTIALASGVPLVLQSPGEALCLPEPRKGILLVVSALLRSCLPGRPDLVSPARLVRGSDGDVEGCRALVCNHGVMEVLDE
jgi:hypothetical protein